jgi:hypothetical protein
MNGTPTRTRPSKKYLRDGELPVMSEMRGLRGVFHHAQIQEALYIARICKTLGDSTWLGPGWVRGIVLVGCLFFGWTSRMAAQDTQGSLGQWEGTVFTPALEKVSQDESSVLLTTLRIEGSYDSNVLSSQLTQLSTVYSLIEGEARYSLQQDSDSFLLTYVGGVRFYPQYSNLNTSLQDTRFQWQHHFTKRSKFSVTGRWADLPEGAVDTASPSELLTLIGGSELSASFLQQRIELAEGTLSYEYNYDSVQHYGLGLIDTKEEDAYGGIYYRVTRRQTLGLMYVHQWIYFSQGFQSPQVDNLLFAYSNQLTHYLSLSAFAGPSQVSISTASSSTSTIPQTNSNSKEQGSVGGGKLEATFGRNELRAEYTRLVTGGSGFLTTVLRQTGDLSFSRAVSRRLELSLVGIYTNSRELGTSNSSFETYYVEPSMHYDLTPHLRVSVRGSVGKVQGLAQFGTISRNQVTTQIEYRFREIPIGR